MMLVGLKWVWPLASLIGAVKIVWVVENETVEIPGADEADSHRLFLFGQSTQANGASDRLDVFLLIAKKGCAVVR